MDDSCVFATTDADFENDVLKSPVPVLVDFWATWCTPCLALSPVIDELARENQGRIKVFKLNTDENPETPSRYGVRGIPTVIIFKNGEVVNQNVGNAPKAALQDMITRAV